MNGLVPNAPVRCRNWAVFGTRAVDTRPSRASGLSSLCDHTQRDPLPEDARRVGRALLRGQLLPGSACIIVCHIYRIWGTTDKAGRLQHRSPGLSLPALLSPRRRNEAVRRDAEDASSSQRRLHPPGSIALAPSADRRPRAPPSSPGPCQKKKKRRQPTDNECQPICTS